METLYNVVIHEKYSFVYKFGEFKILRYGEEWVDLSNAPGNKAILALVGEVEDLRKEVADLQNELDNCSEN